MAIGAFVPTGGRHYEGRVTPFVVFTCLVAATGGLIFGYDIGIAGGVTSMEPFLQEFFPSVYHKMHSNTAHENAYCKFDSLLLTLFNSSLYLSALVASLFASTVTRTFGRKTSMLWGGIIFLAGSAIAGGAVHVSMLIIGRLMLGVGVGFANQSVPVYLSEMAPAQMRGALNIGFQFAITFGILSANLINYGTARIEGGWGWRVSLGLAAVPAIIMTVGAYTLPETPNSMIERGHADKAKKMLQKIRGVQNVDAELQDLVEASEQAKKVLHPWKSILEHKYRPALVMAVFIPFFQQLTGINVILFYAPVLFRTIGSGNHAALMSAVITGCVINLCTLVSIFTVDKYGRRALFLEGGVQMLVCQIAVGAIIGVAMGADGAGTLSRLEADMVLMLVSVFVAGFAWSWGPLGWLVPSEIFPLEIRSAGQAVNVTVNMFWTFAIAQCFLPMLCHFKFGLFFFFAGFEAIMTVFIYYLLPETKGCPIEEINRVWKAHWLWSKYIPEDAVISNINTGNEPSS